MNERPKALILSAPMMRAILEGKKTQIRRVVEPQPPDTMTYPVSFFPASNEWCFTGPQRDLEGNELPFEQWEGGWPVCGPNFTCPFGQPGDLLWMPETWRWPSLGLELTEVRVQRLQEISEADAWDEGIKRTGYTPEEFARNQAGDRDVLIASVEQPQSSRNFPSAKEAFAFLWESVNGPGSWAANPWVWVGTFRRVDAAERAA